MSTKYTVQIHLLLQVRGDGINVDFPFDTMNDDFDEIVDELAQSLELDNSAKENAKSMILHQINMQNSSDDEDIVDPRYVELKRDQTIELQELIRKHTIEKENYIKMLSQKTTNPSSSLDLLWAPQKPSSNSFDDLIEF